MDEVSQETIDTLLAEYPEDMRFLRRAFYDAPLSMVGHFQTVPSWAYQGPEGQEVTVNHFTAAEGIFAHNQLGYVLAACIAETGNFENVKALPMSIINRKKYNEILILRQQGVYHRTFIASEPFEGISTVTRQQVKRTKSGIYLFLTNEFEFEGGKSTGSSDIAIHLEPEEIEDLSKIAVSSGLKNG